MSCSEHIPRSEATPAVQTTALTGSTCVVSQAELTNTSISGVSTSCSGINCSTTSSCSITSSSFDAEHLKAIREAADNTCFCYFCHDVCVHMVELPCGVHHACHKHVHRWIQKKNPSFDPDANASQHRTGYVWNQICCICRPVPDGIAPEERDLSLVLTNTMTQVRAPNHSSITLARLNPNFKQRAPCPYCNKPEEQTIEHVMHCKKRRFRCGHCKETFPAHRAMEQHVFKSCKGLACQVCKRRGMTFKEAVQCARMDRVKEVYVASVQRLFNSVIDEMQKPQCQAKTLYLVHIQTILEPLLAPLIRPALGGRSINLIGDGELQRAVNNIENSANSTLLHDAETDRLTSYNGFTTTASANNSSSNSFGTHNSSTTSASLQPSVPEASEDDEDADNLEESGEPDEDGVAEPDLLDDDAHDDMLAEQEEKEAQEQADQDEQELTTQSVDATDDDVDVDDEAEDFADEQEDRDAEEELLNGPIEENDNSDAGDMDNVDDDEEEELLNTSQEIREMREIVMRVAESVLTGDEWPSDRRPSNFETTDDVTRPTVVTSVDEVSQQALADAWAASIARENQSQMRRASTMVNSATSVDRINNHSDELQSLMQDAMREVTHFMQQQRQTQQQQQQQPSRRN